MRILVTGGCGFIGSHLTNTLIEKGHEVVVLDNLVSGKKERLDPKAVFIHGDIISPDDIKRAIEGCGAVFHLAALTDLRRTTDEMISKVNLVGSKNVFSAAEENNAKVIFTSSAAVYGNSRTAEDSECNPLSFYGENKLEAEKILLDAFIARLFNVYGPYGKSFVNTLCRRIPLDEEVTVYGDGSMTRDYIYVEDVVSSDEDVAVAGDQSVVIVLFCYFEDHVHVSVCTNHLTPVRTSSFELNFYVGVA